jgi:hypothetical protein
MKILASSVLLLAIAAPGFAEIAIHTKDGQVFRVPVEANNVATIEFVSGAQPEAGRNISGVWDDDGANMSKAQVIYSQVGNQISVQGSFIYNGVTCEWNGSGTINGNKVEHTVNYTKRYPDPSWNKADGKLVLTLSPDGKSLTGTWYNNTPGSGPKHLIRRK